MSTNISDLPGPQPEDSPEYDYNLSEMEQADIDQTEMEEIEKMIRSDEIENKEQFMNNFNGGNTNKSINELEQPSNIRMDIRKANNLKKKDDDIYSQFNEENLLILIILYISSIPISNEYTRNLFSMISFNVNNNLIITITKCVLLLLIFIIVKLYILPNIKV
jgi:hypothetical protein